jgi:hypothetical protein
MPPGLPPWLRRIAVTPTEAIDLLRRGLVRVLVLDEPQLTDSLREAIDRLRRQGLPIPVVGVVAALARATPEFSDAAWVQADGKIGLMEVIASTAIPAMLSEAARQHCAKVDARDRCDAALCRLFTQVPPFANVDA